MPRDTMRTLLIHQLQELHAAELQIADTWPALTEHATTQSLRLALRIQQDDTMRQLVRLEHALELLEATSTDRPSPAIARKLRTARLHAEAQADPAIRDAGILLDCQAILGFQVAAYATACIFADALGHTDIADLLERTLTEEEVADGVLTEIERHEVPRDRLLAGRRHRAPISPHDVGSNLQGESPPIQ